MEKVNIDLVNKVLEQITETLIEKNKRYGNSALSPIGIFYKGKSTNSIEIRIDDKINRIKNSDTLRTNDVYDLLGYLYLYSISRGIFMFNTSNTFEEKVRMISEHINGCINYYAEHKINKERFSIFEKENTNNCNISDCIRSIDVILNGIKNRENPNEEDIIELLNLIVLYFVYNNETDFKNLID